MAEKLGSAAEICIFGAGVFGRTIGFQMIKCAGFAPDYYCDNNPDRHGKEINGIPVRPPQYLYERKADTVICVAVSTAYSQEIVDQLTGQGFDWERILVTDYLLMQEIIESVADTQDPETKGRWKLFLDDEAYLRWRYREVTGREPDLQNPRSFNEKLQWLKLHDRKPEYTGMVDKYAVKEYVSALVGKEHVIPTLGIWDRFEDIPFSALPDRFVLKCTHDSGSAVICTDRLAFDLEKAKKKIEDALRRNYYYPGREWPYKDVKPRILAEPYLSDDKGELNDYKIFCFNGVPKMIQVDFDRFRGHKRNLYTTDWSYIDAEIQYPTDPKHVIPKPEQLDEMLKLAGILSKPHKHMRTDFYCVNGRVYFGELTFFHGSGLEWFRPAEMEYRLGEYITI